MNKQFYKIKDLPPQDRPREKLIKSGPSALTESELLAIILNTGVRKSNQTEDVLTLSERILSQYGDRAITEIEDVTKLAQSLDIPPTKAAQVIACFQLGKHYFSKTFAPVFIHGPQDVYRHLKPVIAKLKKEQLHGLYLNSRNQLVHEEIISIGTLTQTLTDPREVFRPAIAHSALAIILAHNHPSGHPEPSTEDLKLTQDLISAGKLLNIHVIDHIVITDGAYTSLRKSRYVNEW